MLDVFVAEPVIGPATSGRTRWLLAMTKGSVLKEPIGRPRQTEIFAQGRAFVFAAEQAAPLQFGNDLLDEIFEAARENRKHDGKPVGAFGLEPLLHLVGNGLWRADHREAGIAA